MVRHHATKLIRESHLMADFCDKGSRKVRAERTKDAADAGLCEHLISSPFHGRMNMAQPSILNRAGVDDGAKWSGRRAKGGSLMTFSL